VDWTISFAREECTPHSVKALSDMPAIVVDHPRRYSIGEIDLYLMDGMDG
jgi:hypothetical protein